MIDFREIDNPSDFEQFSSEFLKIQGYDIVSDPADGIDGGIDLKIKETFNPDGNKEDFYWLVSCKHYAKSKKSIGVKIEQDILDRVKSNNCDGFIGFYSTTITQGLYDKLEGLKKDIKYLIFNHKKIESIILGSLKYQDLFYRYFPDSYKSYKEVIDYMEPIKLFDYYFNSKPNLTNNLFLFFFKSTDILLKVLKKYDSLKEALEKYNNYTMLEYQDESFDVILPKLKSDEPFIKCWEELMHYISLDTGFDISTLTPFKSKVKWSRVHSQNVISPTKSILIW